jgi:hypothetical protein
MRLAVTIAVLAFIATPYLDGSAQEASPTAEKIARAEEASCVANLRAINVSQNSYWGGERTKGYAATLRELGPAGAGFLEPVIATGKKDGYRHTLTPKDKKAGQPIRHYSITAGPRKRLVNDQKSFFTDETGVIRFTDKNRVATSADTPLEAARNE